MSIFILISVSYYGMLSFQEFQDKDHCEAARTVVEQLKIDSSLNPKYYKTACVLNYDRP